jgi:hypothetical protein
MACSCRYWGGFGDEEKEEDDGDVEQKIHPKQNATIRATIVLVDRGCGGLQKIRVKMEWRREAAVC